MPSKSFDLVFDGYWREENFAGIPSESGIYCVYVCTFNPTEKTVTLVKLLYIGASENANHAVAAHPLRKRWREEVTGPFQQICVSFAEANLEDIEMIAAALVNSIRPVTNPMVSKPTTHFSVSVSGRTAFLSSISN